MANLGAVSAAGHALICGSAGGAFPGRHGRGAVGKSPMRIGQGSPDFRDEQRATFDLAARWGLLRVDRFWPWNGTGARAPVPFSCDESFACIAE